MAAPELAEGRLPPSQRICKSLASHSPGMSCSMLHLIKAGRHVLSRKPLGSIDGKFECHLQKSLNQHKILSLVSCTYEHEGLERLSVPLYICSTALALKLCPALKVHYLYACRSRVLCTGLPQDTLDARY